MHPPNGQDGNNWNKPMRDVSAEIQLLLGFTIGSILVVSCSGPSSSISDIPTTTQLIQPTETLATNTPEPTLPPPTTSPTPLILPDGSTLLSEQQASLSITFSPISQNLPEDLIVYYGDIGILDDFLDLMYVSLDRDQGDLLSVKYIDLERFMMPFIFPADLPGGGHHLAFVVDGLGVPVVGAEIYIVDLQRQSWWGLQTSCWDGGVSLALGLEYLAYMCHQTPNRWIILALDDPTNFHDIELMGYKGGSGEARWLDKNTLYVKDSTYIDLVYEVRCLVRISSGDQKCTTLKDWYPGMLSQDNSMIEVRQGKHYRPEFTGEIPFDCIFSDNCELSLSRNQLINGQNVIYGASWIPETADILYIQDLFNESGTTSASTTKLWRYNSETKQVELLTEFFPPAYFTLDSESFTPAIWSPDGRSVVLDGTQIGLKLYNIDTGELTTLVTEGIAIGTITLP
jgi:hypothetical protein